MKTVKDRLFYAAAKAVVQQGNVFLLLKSGRYSNYPFDLPGGTIEFNETIEEALLRELKEEINVSDNQMFSKLYIGGYMSHKLIEKNELVPKGVVYFVYHVVLKDSVNISLSSEHESLKWCTIEEFNKQYGNIEPEIVNKFNMVFAAKEKLRYTAKKKRGNY